MKDYVEYFIELEPFYGFSWQVALLVMLLFFLSRYLDHIKTYLKALVAVALLALSGMYYTQTALQQRNKDFYTLMQNVSLHRYRAMGRHNLVRRSKL